METQGGVKLTKRQIKQVKALRKLAKDWDKDLWLWAAAGRLCVMLRGDTEQNPNPEIRTETGMSSGCANADNLVDTIYEIPCDGGDW